MADTTKLSISLPDDLARRVREFAEDQTGGNVSAWFASLAEREVRRAQARAAVAEFESEHGVLTEDEIRAARARWIE